MNAFVVDTNVMVAANGGDLTHADHSCQLTCVDRLEELRQKGTVALDCKGLILDEYSRHMSWSGGPGMGDAFFKFLFDRQYACNRVQRVSITQSDNDNRSFEELPENGLDPSDRKFLAVAVAADAVILNATDSDWQEQSQLMERLGVNVAQLCPQHADR